MNASSPIGIFDSGMGGISVLSTIHEILPNEDLIFFGDSKYNPYGTKTKEEITQRCIEICDKFIAYDVKAIVIACNTATSACVNLLREKYDIDIIGMEPALKLACQQGEHQKIAVWATDFTLKEKKFASLMEKFEDDHSIDKVPCPKLVRLVEEKQATNMDVVKPVLYDYLKQSNLDSLDSIVLGCTHFLYFKKSLQEILPSHVSIIDGNLGTTNHLKNVLMKKGLLNEQGGRILWKNSLEDKIQLEKELYDLYLQIKD